MRTERNSRSWTRGKSLLWLSVVVLLFAACGDDDGEATATTVAATTQPIEQTTQAPQTTQPTEQTTQAPVETTEAPMEERPFVIAVPGDIENLDGMGTYTQFAAQVWFHTHGRLMRFKELPSPTAPGSIVLDKNTAEPELAESLVTEDFQTWTLTLREGLVFPSGNPLTTDDVIYSFDRAISLAGSPGFLLNTAGITDIGQVEKIDDVRLTITVPKPNNRLPRIFALVDVVVMDSKLLTDNATDDDPWTTEWAISNHAGYGRYLVKEWEPGSRLVLSPNPDWYEGPPETGDLVFQVVPNEANRLLLLQRGEADVATFMTPRTAVGIDPDDPDVAALKFPSDFVNTVTVNHGVAPFDNTLVRQAIAHAVNYEQIREEGWFGLATPPSSPVIPGYEGHVAVWDYSHDPERARQLLSEAGFPDGFETRMLYSPEEDPSHEALAVMIQGQLEDVGIKVTLEQVTGGQFFTRFYGERDFEIALKFCGIWVSEYWYSSNLMMATNGFCSGTYSNPSVDEAIAALETETDPAAAQALATQVQEQFAEDAGYVLIGQPDFIVMTRKGVSGVIYPVQDGTAIFWDLTR